MNDRINIRGDAKNGDTIRFRVGVRVRVSGVRVSGVRVSGVSHRDDCSALLCLLMLIVICT